MAICLKIVSHREFLKNSLAYFSIKEKKKKKQILSHGPQTHLFQNSLPELNVS